MSDALTKPLPVWEEPFPETVVHMKLDGTSRKYIPVDGEELKENYVTRAEYDRVCAELAQWTTWDDVDDEYTAEIDAAFPTRSGSHDKDRNEAFPYQPLGVYQRCLLCGYGVSFGHSVDQTGYYNGLLHWKCRSRKGSYSTKPAPRVEGNNT